MIRTNNKFDGAKVIHNTKEMYLSYGINLTDKEAVEVIDNLCEYAKVLIEIDQEISKSNKSGAIDGL